MNFGKIWICINIIFYFGLGVLTLIKPQYIAETVGFKLMTPGAVAELKAAYGGLLIAFSGIMYLLYFKAPITYSFAFLALIYLGYGGGRLIGVLGNHAYDRTTLIYLTIEISSFFISSWLYFKNSR